jgi:hypothetical protein
MPKPGPLTGLFIPVEGVQLYPAGGTLAVVRATINGTGRRTSITIKAPAEVAARYQGPQALYVAEQLDLPNWRQVDARYAGQPREFPLNPELYIAIWRAWWFDQGGHSFDPDRIITIRTEAAVSMTALWECFVLVRALALRAAKGEGAYEALALVAHGRPYDPWALAKLRKVSPKLADLVLHRDNSFNRDMAGVIAALTRVELDFSERRITLADPWFRSASA